MYVFVAVFSVHPHIRRAVDAFYTASEIAEVGVDLELESTTVLVKNDEGYDNIGWGECSAPKCGVS